MIRTRPPEYQVYRRAREKALRRLANAYPDQYKQYLEEEKASERENKGDAGIAGITTAGAMDTRPTTTFNTRTKASNAGEDEGYNGGEA